MIYKLQPFEGNYEWIELVGLDSFGLGEMIDARSPLLPHWTPFKVRRGHPTSDKKKAKEADFPWYGGGGNFGIFLRPRAVEALRPILEACGEILRVDDEEGQELYIFHCLNFVDALDEKKSEIKYFTDSTKILRVLRYEFRPEVIVGLDIFRLTQSRPASIFVSQRFVDAVEAAKLVGMKFEAVWPFET